MYMLFFHFLLRVSCSIFLHLSFFYWIHFGCGLCNSLSKMRSPFYYSNYLLLIDLYQENPLLQHFSKSCYNLCTPHKVSSDYWKRQCQKNWRLCSYHWRVKSCIRFMNWKINIFLYTFFLIHSNTSRPWLLFLLMVFQKLACSFFTCTALEKERFYIFFSQNSIFFLFNFSI